VSALAILGMAPQIIGSVTQLQVKKSGAGRMHQYFHVLGIDVLPAETGDPVVLELNDRPSMKITFPFERDLKRNLIVDALKILASEDREAPAGRQRLGAAPPRRGGKPAVESDENDAPALGRHYRAARRGRGRSRGGEGHRLPEAHARQAAAQDEGISVAVSIDRDVKGRNSARSDTRRAHNRQGQSSLVDR